MPTERTPLLDGTVRVLELTRFRDERGSLVFADGPYDADEYDDGGSGDAESAATAS